MADPRNVLITGGNRGIGLSIARAFVQAGDNVVITHRSGEPPQGLQGVICEVTDSESVNAAFTAAEEKLGGPIEVTPENRKHASGPAGVMFFSVRVAPGATLGRWIRAPTSGGPDAR